MPDRTLRTGASTILGLLDVGSAKIACMIAEVSWTGADGPTARLLGLGHQRSRGVKAGVVVNLDEAEAAVRAAIGQAERMAGFTLDAVVLSVACGRIKSANFTARATLQCGVVEDEDVERAFAGAEAYVDRDGRSLVQLTPNGFQLDGVAGITDPRGMAGRQLVLSVNAVTADDAPLRNLLAVVERCHVSVAGIVAAPFASAMAATTADERRLGVTCVDMGAGTTTLAGIAEGRLVFADVLLIGGALATYDIARTLSTSLQEAERIKVLYGTIARAMSDERELIPYRLAGEDGPQEAQVSRAGLVTIIEPRIELLLRQVRERLEVSGVGDRVASRLVLTGGASGLAGLGAFAAQRLGCVVRVGRGACAGIPESVCDQPFASVIGLLVASMAPRSVVRAYRDRQQLAPGYLGRVRDWVRGF